MKQINVTLGWVFVWVAALVGALAIVAGGAVIADSLPIRDRSGSLAILMGLFITLVGVVLLVQGAMFEFLLRRRAERRQERKKDPKLIRGLGSELGLPANDL